MGAVSSLEKAKAVYDLMNGRANTHAAQYFSADVIFFTDVQPEGTERPLEYAIIKQINTLLEPATVSGNKRKQLATLIVEFNVRNENVEAGRDLQTMFTHHMSAESFSSYDVAIDSITTNDYTNTHGTQFVTVIDFNYFVRV